MQSNLMKKAAMWFAVLFVFSMGTILYLSKEKVITISDVAQDEVQETVITKDEMIHMQEKHVLTFVLGESDTSYMRIPIPAGSKAESVVVENHYMDRELWVLIKEAEEAYSNAERLEPYFATYSVCVANTYIKRNELQKALDYLLSKKTSHYYKHDINNYAVLLNKALSDVDSKIQKGYVYKPRKK